MGLHGQNNGTNGAPFGAFFKSPESDCSIYDGCHPWFASDSAPVQTVATAIRHWELTVGRGGEYILNVPPSKAGVIGDREAAAAAALGAAVEARYGCGNARPCEPLASTTAVVKQGDSLVLQFPTHNADAGHSFNRVWLSEDVVNDAQRVQSYRLESLQPCSVNIGAPP